jgi:hypothetical protein
MGLNTNDNSHRSRLPTSVSNSALVMPMSDTQISSPCCCNCMARPLLDSALSIHNIILDSLFGQFVAQSLMSEFDCVTDVEYDSYDAHAVAT